VKRILLSVFIGLLGLGFTATDVEAKRLGGGLSQGMKRQPAPAPTTPPPQQAPQKPAATPGATTTAAAPAAVAPRRSWLGPIAGLAAGLGIAALLSHFGLGEGFANMLTLLLVVLAVVWVVRFMWRRFAPAAPQPAGAAHAAAAGAPWRSEPAFGSTAAPIESRPAPALAHDAPALPAGFDRAEFERAAKTIFIRMQAANDAGDLEDLRQFSTPEMFAAFRVDLQDRRGSQRTDVVTLNADLVDAAVEDGRQIVSVRYHGLLREEDNGVAAPFDEVWHLVRPADGHRPWAIAGIQQAVTH
jgi:predicted lipid-binding transport protein (Tim44 family)